MNTINKLTTLGIFLSLMFVMFFATNAVALACTSGSSIGQDYTGCSGNAVYWFDSCDNQLELYQQCNSNQVCENAQCKNVQTQNIACSNNYQCGSDEVIGSLFCQGNNVYQNYKIYKCNNPGTVSSSCSSSIVARWNTACSGNQTCSNGSCINTCTQNYQQRCSGNSMYWYDSCGVQGNYVGTCGTNANLIVTKTVKDITTNTALASSTYANPLDVVMFMITLRADNGDAQNVYVKDTLSSSLAYKNQMTVACTTNNGNSNCNSGFSGDIISGLRLNTINAGQTVTVSYQAQLADPNNFSFGSTTLSDPVATTSSNVGPIPNAIAPVTVAKAGVLGASTISTGLTNNFWVDSFFLPLLITLIVIWMWKSGMFFGIEKWLDSKKKVRRGYKAEKEFLNRIEKINKNS